MSITGDTLLAIQAPSGTQLEVPVPHVVCRNNYFGLIGEKEFIEYPLHKAYNLKLFFCISFIKLDYYWLVSQIVFKNAVFSNSIIHLNDCK